MHAPDFDTFRELLDDEARFWRRQKPDDAQIQDYWHALKDLPIEIVQGCARRHRQTGRFFPLPADLRPKGEKPRDAEAGPARNHVRDYWRSCVVNATAQAMGHTPASLEPVLVANKDSLVKPMFTLLGDLETQSRRDGYTTGQHIYAQRQCETIARMFPGLCTDRAPQLPAPVAEADEMFA